MRTNGDHVAKNVDKMTTMVYFVDKMAVMLQKEQGKMVTTVRKIELEQKGDYGAFVDKIAVMLQKGHGKNGNYGTKKRTWTNWRSWC